MTDQKESEIRDMAKVVYDKMSTIQNIAEEIGNVHPVFQELEVAILYVMRIARGGPESIHKFMDVNKELLITITTTDMLKRFLQKLETQKSTNVDVNLMYKEENSP